MKWMCEVVQDFDGSYYANMTNENGAVRGIPEYVSYRELREGIRSVTGISLVLRKALRFKQIGRKKYALVQNVYHHPQGCCVDYTDENLKMAVDGLIKVV